MTDPSPDAPDFEACPICPAMDPEIASRMDRRSSVREHLIEDHGAPELADALLLARSGLADMTIHCSKRVAHAAEAAHRIGRAECAAEQSPLSKSIVDAWPGGTPFTSEIAALVGERLACTRRALSRLAAQRVVKRLRGGRWELR